MEFVVGACSVFGPSYFTTLQWVYSA